MLLGWEESHFEIAIITYRVAQKSLDTTDNTLDIERSVTLASPRTNCDRALRLE